MEARVKDNCRWNVITACSGMEYVKGQWRPVPFGYEEEAKANPFLEIKKEERSKTLKGSITETEAEAKDESKARRSSKP